MNRKKPVLIAFAVAALTVSLAATAFACTVFRGTFTLKGNASATSVTATGLASGMSQMVSSGIAKAKKTGGTVTLSTGKDQYGRALPARTGYRVRYYNSTATAPGYSTHTTWKTDCMVGGPGIQIGLADVGSDGKIVGQPKTYSIGNSANLDSGGKESAVCISDSGAAFGNMAPVAIVL